MSEEEIIEENIRRYIKEHSTTIKAYTQKYVDDLQNQLQQKDKEIERLKELCDKYEEEHKTTFEEWKKTINIIKEVREYILKEDEWVKNSNYKLLKTDKLLEILDKENK